MDNGPMHPVSLPELLLSILNKLKQMETDIVNANKRIDVQQQEINSRIRIPCPAKGCLKYFQSNGHRNRHIRNSIKKGPEREPRWKEHEDARGDLKLALKEDTDNDSDQDNELREPQTEPAVTTLPNIPALTGFEGYPPSMEVRTTAVPENTAFFHTSMGPMILNPRNLTADEMMAYLPDVVPEISNFEASASNAIDTATDNAAQLGLWWEWLVGRDGEDGED
ncbi:hypothetical protein F5X98DRAFT_383060 [Xylaria grammica]|nr:hypothetical protein F5X98DRAFT_383060 [Xylaria grammica]